MEDGETNTAVFDSMVSQAGLDSNRRLSEPIQVHASAAPIMSRLGERLLARRLQKLITGGAATTGLEAGRRATLGPAPAAAGRARRVFKARRRTARRSLLEKGLALPRWTPRPAPPQDVLGIQLQQVHEVRDNARPPCLMAGTEACAVVSMKVLIK